jgi:hypothetical protein
VRLWARLALSAAVVLAVSGVFVGLSALVVVPDAPEAPESDRPPTQLLSMDTDVASMRAETRAARREQRETAKAEKQEVVDLMARQRKAERARETERLAWDGRKPDSKFDSDSKSQMRQEMRKELVDDILFRLDGHGQGRGWDEATTDTVRALFLDSSEHVSLLLGSVDEGSSGWDEVRRELREYRLDTARDVEEVLGKSEWDVFVSDMQFGRFTEGDEPVRGRLNGD